MVIKTEFDNPLEEDVVFEETDQTSDVEDILKNSENLMKAFLYMRKMFSSSVTNPTEFDYVSSDGQRDFTVNGHFFSYAMVFTEGVKELESSFEIVRDNNGSTISFADAKSEGLRITIVIFS